MATGPETTEIDSPCSFDMGILAHVTKRADCVSFLFPRRAQKPETYSRRARDTRFGRSESSVLLEYRVTGTQPASYLVLSVLERSVLVTTFALGETAIVNRRHIPNISQDRNMAST